MGKLRIKFGQKMRSLPPRVFLDQTLTKQLIKSKFGTLAEMPGAWENSIKDIPGFPALREKATIERWLLNGITVRRGNDEGSMTEPDLGVFAIPALLDVDIFALLDLQRNGYLGKFAHLRQLIYRGRRALGGLAPLLDMYGPADNWPSDRMAEKTYGRKWFRWNFDNERAFPNDDYLRISLEFRKPTSSAINVAHIAYRRLGSMDTMWRYYGAIIGDQYNTRKLTESGELEDRPTTTKNQLTFQTYFGGRPVEWQVASIHEFHPKHEIDNTEGEVVRFRW